MHRNRDGTVIGGPVEPVLARMDDRPRQVWDDPVRGALSWVTLFDRAVTPTAGLTAGVAELGPGQGGNPHRHAQPEIYYMLQGVGTLTVEGVDRTVTAGDSAFIPGNSWHCLRNAGPATVRLLYVFPADGMDDIVYEYREP